MIDRELCEKAVEECNQEQEDDRCVCVCERERESERGERPAPHTAICVYVYVRVCVRFLSASGVILCWLLHRVCTVDDWV